MLTVNAQVLHKAGEECGFEVRVVFTRLPHCSVFFTVGINFFHAFVGEEDVGRTVFTLFDADDELVAFAGRVDAAQADFVQQAAQAVLRDFGSVFCPLGFHLTDGRFFRFDVETVFLPEHFQQRPNFARRFAFDNQPALVAVTLKAYAFNRFQNFCIGRLLYSLSAAFVQVAGADGAAACR